MNFTPTTKTVRNLLSSGCQFAIPRFQREYSWDKKNCEEFLSDLIGNLKMNDRDITDDQYFLGTMLFIGDFADRPEKPIEVVDGQQRLTTITILLSVIAEQFRKINEEKLSQLIFKYIMMVDDNGEEIRVLKTISSYPYFVYFIQDWKKENQKEPTTDEEKIIEETYNYFIQQTSEENLKKRLLDRWNDKGDDINNLDYVTILKAVRDQVLNCIFISIAAADKDQANRIFAILNAKGKRLVSVDLIKNRIFEVLKDGVDAVIADDNWNKIKEALYSGDENVGLSTFFRHYWSSKYSKTSENHLYDSFKEKVPYNADSYKKFLDDLLKNAITYKKIISPNRSDYDNRKEYYWLVQSLKDITDTFNIVQARFPLLALFDAKERSVITARQFKNAIKAIENFHFAYTVICSLRANGFEGAYSSFAIALRKCNTKDQAQQVLDKKLYATLEKLYPGFDLFSSEFIKLSYSGKQNNPDNVKTKYAINQLNNYFSGKEIYEDDGSIEHIYPESAGDQALNIGNLILLEGTINVDAGNREYVHKLEFYNKSNYKWIKAYIRRFAEWNESMIPSRAEELAKLYYKNILNRELTEDVDTIV